MFDDAAKLLPVDPLIDDEAENILNPRPSSKTFASLAEREYAHNKLFHEGVAATASGDLDAACAKFSEAYALLFRTSTLLSLVDLKLKLGESELAYACYAKILKAPGAIGSRADVLRAQAKLSEARQLHADVRAIMEAPQAGVLNSHKERERAHHRLVERAKAANDKGDRAKVRLACERRRGASERTSPATLSRPTTRHSLPPPMPRD